MKIVIRMDDITPGMNWGKFNRFKELLDLYNIKPLIGVVPDNQDPNLNIEKDAVDFWEKVKTWQDNGWIIALHGMNHIYTTAKGGCFPLNNFSEYAGVPYEKQYEMIFNGKQILKNKGISTDIFMAPGHSYDKNTLKALKENGFNKITDGFGYNPYKWNEMIFYPISMNKKNALKKDKEGIVTFVVHTNTMNESEYDFYKNILSEGKKVVSYQEMMDLEPDKRGFLGHIKEIILASAKRVMVMLIAVIRK